MTSSPGTHSNSPSEVDFSVIRTSIQMGHTMVDQILQGVHYGSDEVRGLLRNECDIILECKVCRNLFRSFPNFVAHKRVYCIEMNHEKLANDHLSVLDGEEETLVINPEDTNNRQTTDASKQQQSVDTENSVIEKVINQTFAGKSKAYQFYTKIAEDVEKKRIAKVTNTLTVTSIPTTQNAMIVSYSNGDNSNADQHLKSGDKTHQNPVKKKNLIEVCAGLAKGKILNKNEETNSNGDTNKNRIVPLRSRKSFSEQQSLDFLDSIEKKEGNSVDFDTDVDMLKWTDDSYVDEETTMVMNDNVNDKDWLKYCDVKRYLCKVCKKQFSCLYSLKFHAKSKHSNSSAQFVCPLCDLTFKYFTALAYHLRNLHKKSEPYIDNIKTTLQKDKSFEMKELVEEDSIESTEISGPPKASTSNLLPCATGWKKCDKCGKVCWKAKSFKRHYSSCKGSRNKIKQHAKGKASNAGSNSNNEVEKNSENTKANKASGNTKQSAALTKLHEKPTANVFESTPILQDRNNEKDVNKRKETGDLKNMLNSDNILLDRDTQIYDDDIMQKESQKADSVSDANIVHKTEFKTLKELLAKQAGLRGTMNIVECESKNNKPYSTKLLAQFKGNLTEDVLLTEYKDDILNAKTDVQTTIIKEQKQNKQPEEIKQHEVSYEESVNNKMQMDENINNKQKVEISEHDVSNVSTMYSLPSKGNVSDDNAASDFIEKPENESLVAKQNTLLNKCVLSHDGRLESLSATISARRTRNLSKDGQTTDGKPTPVSKELESVADVDATAQIKTPEKMKIDPQLSACTPLPSPLHMSTLPVSPTASVHSTSTDIYNSKFKMTVKEMAELVESTSLTKFVRERKKKARKILNKTCTKSTTKARASLDLPLKRRLEKRKRNVKNVYGTRHSASNEIKSSFGHDRKYSLRKVSTQSENSDSPTPESSWQARERKRLENTAGFLENNYYAAKATKCLETEHMDTSVEIKKSRSISIDKKREISKERIEIQTSQRCNKNRNEKVDESLKDGCNKGQKINLVDGKAKEISRKSRNQKRIAYSEGVDESQKKVSRKRRLEHYAGYGEGRMHSDTSSSSRNSSSERRNLVCFVKTPENIEEGQKAESTLNDTKNTQLIMKSSPVTNAEASDSTFNDHTKMDEASLLKANDILIEQMLDCITSGALKDKLTDHINRETVLVNVTNSTESINIGKNSTNKKNSHNNRAIIEIDSPKLQSDTEMKVLQQDENGKTDLILGTSKHRTRLATGSIFFDSELLKLSPTKAEKKIALAKANKIAEPCIQEVKEQSSSPGGKLLVGQKKSHCRTANGTPRYSLSTGVKKCLKCNKTFWKSKSYQCHLTRSACKKGNQQQNGSKKRPLSLSPSKCDTAQTSAENQHIREMESETKRANTDSDAVEKVFKGMSASPNSATNKNSQERGDEISIIDSCVRCEKVTQVDINIESKDLSSEHNGVKSTDGSSTENRVNSREFTEITTEKASISDINVNDILNNVSCLDLPYIVKSTDSNDSVNNNNDIKETNVFLEAKNAVTVIDKMCHLSSASVITDADSVDNESEFSGFSEDELKASELELSIVDVNLEPDEHYTVNNNNMNMTSQKVEDLKTVYSGSGGKVEMNVDKNLIDVLKKDSTKKSNRPVRKSAQNRFCHVEEIWVYKEPGKPVVEKVKNVKNREYVLDAENPLKLHCHNNKDVDKLIDEEKLKCRQCDTPCTSISNLRRHIIRHLGWKRYKCKVCAFACYDMSECRLHISRSHDENLTNKNFTRLVSDLKREAAKKRAAKRTNTLRSHKEQASVLECEAYKKPGQTVMMKDIHKESTLVNNDNIFEKIENQKIGKVISPKLTPQKLSLCESKESERKKTEKQSSSKSHCRGTGILCSEAESKQNPNDVHSPILKARMTLLKARMSLAKALGDK